MSDNALTIFGAGVAASGGFLLYRWLSSSDRKTEVIDTYQKCIDAVKTIRRHCREMPVLGFDCEWMLESRVSLLQLCTHKGYCVLIRLVSLQTIPALLLDLLADPNVIKVGVGVDKDARFLNNNRLRTVSTLDLRFVAVLTGGAKPQNLAAMYKEVCGKTLNKAFSLFTSDWEKPTLDKEQIQYAADDAIAGIEVYMKLAKSVPHVNVFREHYDMYFEPYYHNGLLPRFKNMS